MLPDDDPRKQRYSRQAAIQAQNSDGAHAAQQSHSAPPQMDADVLESVIRQLESGVHRQDRK